MRNLFDFLGAVGLFGSGLTVGVLVTIVIVRTVIRWGGPRKE